MLVVDDDPEILSTLLAILRASHFEPAGASTGRNALALLREQEFDVLLLDVVMPDVDGLEVLRAVRGKKPGLKIIAMSAGGSIQGMDYLRLARDLGADQTLKKPFPAAALLETLRELGPA
ncbi:MAG: response regulator [Planctomycetes bacterium]|nr:response regulator [Planctomycetota bacterium]